jgi:cytochrome P450
MARLSKVAAATAVVGVLSPTSGERLGEVRALELHEAATRLVGLLSLRPRPLAGRELAEADALTCELLRFPAPDEGDGVTGLMAGAGMDAASARGVTAMLMIAGMETTSVALARMTALLSDAAWWPRVAPEAVTPVLGEGLRYLSPLPVVTRTVAEDCEVRGRRFRQGRTVVAHIYNAVRDARVIERGDDFDPERPIPTSLRQLWFGAGTHFCIGMPLAQAVLTKIISGLAELGGVDVVARQPAAGVLIPAYARLLVRRSSPSRETT